MNKIFPLVDDRWTLFLDRDGTINKRLIDAYVTNWEAFEFEIGVLEALPFLSKLFGHTVIVTNQQGIGKELMTHEDLKLIHHNMMEEIWDAGGQIDQIYYCPDLKIYDPVCRKPNPGMALQAQEDFKDIDFNRSIMVGDAETDIEFGNRLGMFTIKLDSAKNESAANYICNDLFEFYLALKKEVFS